MPLGHYANNILFTSEADSAPAQWGGLIVSGGTAHLTYAEVRYGGIGFGCTNLTYSPVCVQNTGTLSIDHVYFHHNSSPVGASDWSGAVAAFSASDAELNQPIHHPFPLRRQRHSQYDRRLLPGAAEWPRCPACDE